MDATAIPKLTGETLKLRHPARLGQAVGALGSGGLIQETLIEEENTDELLSELAEDAINPAAAAA